MRDDLTAVILAAGRGTRMGPVCDMRPKCLVEVGGRPILLRQLDSLRRAGVSRAVVVVGYRAGMVRMATLDAGFEDLTFVYNDEWEHTNYVVSMAKALPFVGGDCVLMHGDVVVSDEVLSSFLASGDGSRVVVDTCARDTGRDFVARVDSDGGVRAIGVGLSGPATFVSQPVYVLSHAYVRAWSLSLEQALSSPGNELRYAEDFLPDDVEPLVPYDVCGGLCSEADTPDDVVRLGPLAEFRDVLSRRALFVERFDEADLSCLGSRPFVVTKREAVISRLSAFGDGAQVASDFPSLPTRRHCARLASSFIDAGCDCVVAVGAGSALDTGKMVRDVVSRFSDRFVPCVAMPTLPGPGAEVTPFASVWDDGVKSSVYGAGLVPDLVVYANEFALTTDAAMRQAGVLDICCHAIESSLSVGATCTSLCEHVLDLVREHVDLYVRAGAGWREMHEASLGAGICIAHDNTNVGHAMGYVLTSDFGVPHGLASALCLDEVLSSSRLDDDGAALLRHVLGLCDVSVDLGLAAACDLASRVNVERLSNFSGSLTPDELASMYLDLMRRLGSR